MIEANELRFGNLVNEEVLGDCKVSGILKETVWVEAKNIKSNGSHNLRDFHINIEYLQPILLTEEWLLKFGFVYTDDVDNLNRDYKLQEFEIQLHLDVNDFICCNTIPNYVQIKYIHTLQNLYFDFTNEELTLNK